MIKTYFIEEFVMTIIDGLIWCYLVTMPIYSYFTYQSEIDAIASGEKSLTTSYWQSIILLWPPAILALYSESFSMPIFVQTNNHLLWQLAILSALATVLVYGIYTVRGAPKTQELVLEQMKSVSWVMPKTSKQFTLYLLGVCTTAGIAEEIIYRGYLLPLLTQYMESYLAIALASLLFGLAHIYQKGSGVIKTGIIGLIFCLMVTIFDSLILAIACHFLIDAYSGYIYYFAAQMKKSA